MNINKLIDEACLDWTIRFEINICLKIDRECFS